MESTWRRDVMWFLVFAVASSAWCVTAARRLGATADEPLYLHLGLERWRTGSHKGFTSVGTMPLAGDLQTLPLYLGERSRGTPYDINAEMAKLLPRARAVTLVFWWALLAHGFLIGRRIAGPWGGRLATALLACEPNLLAHASLATTDIAVSACALALVYQFHAGRERGWLRRVGVPTACFTALMLAKASAVVFGPICILAAGLAWATAHPVPRRFRSLALDAAQVLVLGFVIALAYVGGDWRPSALLPEVAALTLPAGPIRRAGEWFARQPVHNDLTEGILFQVIQNAKGTAAYLFGEVHWHGVWYYFPVALSLKLSVALLALPAVVAALRPRALANWAVATAAALLLLSVTYRVQNGVRIVLPMVTLGVVGLAAALARAGQETTGRRRQLAVAAAVLTVGWMAATAARAWPDGLRYFNEPSRATGRPGYLRLNDSNYDWGQGLKPLDRWHERWGRPSMIVWAFGNDPLIYRMPVRHEVSMGLLAETLKSPDEFLPHVRGHLVAVSALHVYGYFDTAAVRFFRSHRPVAEVSTYLIYDFRKAPE